MGAATCWAKPFRWTGPSCAHLTRVSARSNARSGERNATRAEGDDPQAEIGDVVEEEEEEEEEEEDQRILDFFFSVIGSPSLMSLVLCRHCHWFSIVVGVIHRHVKIFA